MNDLTNYEKEPPVNNEPKEKSMERKKKGASFKSLMKRPENRTIFFIAAAVLMAAVSLCLWRSGIRVGAAAAASAYGTAYESEQTASYETLYQKAYDNAEENYHLSNRVQISIDRLTETAKLEIIKVNDKELITEAPKGVTEWWEVEGEGTFTVDMQAAEFIIDNSRRIVIVRLPNPELGSISITKRERRLYKTTFLRSGNDSSGTDLAEKQESEALLRIRNSLLSNPYISEVAQNIAQNMVTNLIRQVNPDVPDLTVEVEFME